MLGVRKHGGGFRQGRPEVDDNLAELPAGLLGVGLREDCAGELADHFGLPARHLGQDVAQQMNAAALPG